MPEPQSTTAADSSVNAFMSLNDTQQRSMLGKMSPEAKSALLAGVKSRQPKRVASLPGPTTQVGGPTERTEQKDDRGVIEGGVTRAIDTAKAPFQIISAAGDPTRNVAEEVGKGVTETYRQGARQAKDQFYEAAREPNPTTRFLKGARGATTAMSLANPFATGSVVDVNQMQDEGRYREAIGAGAFDVLTLWAGKSSGASKSTQQINKIVSGTGLEVADLERVLPEIEQASKTTGRIQTVGQLQDVINNGSLKLQSEFNQVFDPIKGRNAYTPVVKNHIDRIIRENPHWAQTPSGREKIAAMRRVQRQYDKPWNLEFMSKESSDLRSEIRDYYKSVSSDKRAQLRDNAEMRAKKIVADSFSETVNDHLSHQYGKPQSYYDVLRQKQEAFITMKDHMETEFESLRNKEASQAGKNVSERFKPHAYASAGGPRVHVPFGEAVPSAGPMEQADSKVKQAFRRGGPENRAKTATRATLRALPITHLLTSGTEAKKSRTPPPPEPE